MLRYLAADRDSREAIEHVRLVAPSGERVSLAQLAKIETRDGANVSGGPIERVRRSGMSDSDGC